MNREELYQHLDIDEPAEFQYFENIAGLLECEVDIPYEELYALIEEVDKEVLADLINNYFEEVTDFVPGDEAEFYLLIDKIRLSLMGLAKNSDEENVLSNLVEELDRFRNWYSVESRVICTSILTGDETAEPLRDALTLARLEKIDGDKYSYDFSDCTDYKLDEYIMSFGDIVAAEETEE